MIVLLSRRNNANLCFLRRDAPNNVLQSIDHETINPSIRKVSLNRSSAAKYTSTFDIRRRPLPTDASSGDSVGAGNGEPLPKERQNVNVEEVFHLLQTSLAYKFKDIRKVGDTFHSNTGDGKFCDPCRLKIFQLLVVERCQKQKLADGCL
jgi:hypothetical protein